MLETGPTIPGGFTYTGREYHSRSGLYYYRARFYDPRIGRFITPDPIGQIGGVNLYAYVGNNPVNYVDPLGLLSPTANSVLTAVGVVGMGVGAIVIVTATSPAWFAAGVVITAAGGVATIYGAYNIPEDINSIADKGTQAIEGQSGRKYIGGDEDTARPGDAYRNDDSDPTQSRSCPNSR
ncbi:MAG: RHS repeat-associated core domain-containing protein [Candidatus Lindowbacteria bacterium]|nr:RHS repeat-associated core domain-containing protein [Candidatus Lindowbacteria bacterium]